MLPPRREQREVESAGTSVSAAEVQITITVVPPVGVCRVVDTRRYVNLEAACRVRAEPLKERASHGPILIILRVHLQDTERLLSQLMI